MESFCTDGINDDTFVDGNKEIFDMLIAINEFKGSDTDGINDDTMVDGDREIFDAFFLTNEFRGSDGVIEDASDSGIVDLGPSSSVVVTCDNDFDGFSEDENVVEKSDVGPVFLKIPYFTVLLIGIDTEDCKEFRIVVILDWKLCVCCLVNTKDGDVSGSVLIIWDSAVANEDDDDSDDGKLCESLGVVVTDAT